MMREREVALRAPSESYSYPRSAIQACLEWVSRVAILTLLALAACLVLFPGRGSDTYRVADDASSPRVTAPAPDERRQRIGAQARDRRQVRTVQRLLKGIGYPLTGIDGRYDADARGAVTYFQREHAMSPDGVIDDELLSRLRTERRTALRNRQELAEVGRLRRYERWPELAGAGAALLLGLLGILGAWRSRRHSRHAAADREASLAAHLMAETPVGAGVQRDVLADVATPTPLGQLLLARSAVTDYALSTGLERQARTGGRIGEILLADGAVEPNGLREALAERLGLAPVSPDDRPLPLLPVDQARALRAVALEPANGEDLLPVAFADPDPRVVEAVELSLECAVEPKVSDEHTLDSLLRTAYAEHDAVAVGLALDREPAERWSRPARRRLGGNALEHLARLSAPELPRYTVLVPLRQESSARVRRLFAALREIDYPAERVDGLCLVEADDHPTQALVRTTPRPSWLRLIPVPAGESRSSQRAILYGIRHARGERLTVFRAGDRPDPGELRRAAELFAALDLPVLSFNGPAPYHTVGRAPLPGESASVHFRHRDLVNRLGLGDAAADVRILEGVGELGGAESWAEWVRDYYREEETYDWVAAADRFVGLETFFHRSRARSVRRLVARHRADGDRMLDAGCGTGLNLRHLPEGSVGIDLNPRHVAMAAERLPNHQLVRGDLESIPFGDARFDTALCTEVLEHVPDPAAALGEIHRVLRPGGVLIGSVPARSLVWKLRFLSRTCPGDEPFHNEYLPAEVNALLAPTFQPLMVRRSLLCFNIFFVARKREQF